MILLTLFNLLLLLHVSKATDCVKRTYSGDTFVCVCDAKQCDTLNVEDKIEPNVVHIYDTDQKSSRLEKSETPVDSIKAKSYSSNQFVLNVDTSDLKQKILGFGGCFTDGAVININTLSEDLVKQFMNDYFSKSGLQYNIGRVPIGGSDSSVRAYSLDDTEFDFDLSHFALAEEDTKYRLPMLKLAQQINPEFRAFGSAWSAPAWMKVNHALNGAGGLIWTPGDVYYKLWAKYYVKYLNAYLNEGFKFWGLTTENEPAEGFRQGYAWNALAMTPEEIRDFVKLDLGPALVAAGWGKENLTLMINDDNTNDIESYSSVLLNDAEAAKYVSGIAYHWYSRNYPSSYQILAKVHDQYPNYFLFSSEAGEFGVASQFLGTWNRAEDYAIDILEGLQHWSTGWTDWALAVNTAGGPNWAKNWVDATIVINETAQEYYKNPMYYVLAHFTKFLPIGSTRVGCSVENAPANVHTTSFITPDNKLVLILINTNNDHVDLTINGFAKVAVSTTLKPRSIRNMVIAL
uniref:Glucosylceramidase n=1 Tax=Tetranychus truncatus TaxID=93132 RepID=A0A3G5ANT3_9ACAR|nr:glucosylceramidase-like isoform X1 [Tetranychus truncatus]